MDIRTLVRDELAELLALYQHLNPDDQETDLAQAQSRLELLRRYPGSDIFVGVVEDEIVATCTLIVIPNLTRGGASYALIENVVTHANHREKGHGKAVLLKAIEAAWQAGCYKTMLLTSSQEPGVHTFYLGVGFEQSKTGYQIRRPVPLTV